MDEQNVTSVNAEQVSDEGSQVQTEATQVDTSAESAEVAEPQKPVQSAEENAKYAAIRREAEQKALKERERQDKFAQRYGYSSFDEMEQAEAAREAEAERQRFVEQNGFDPDAIKPVVEQMLKNDPRYQRMEQIERQESVKAALTDLNNELKDAEMDLQLEDLSDTEVAKLPNLDKITDLVKQGQSLANAFFLANKKDILSQRAAKAEQEAIKKITANGASSPGSLATGGDNQPADIWKMSSAEFKALQEKAIRGELKK